MLTKEEQNKIREEIVTVLRESQRFHEQDILNRFPYEGITPILRRLIWEARELVQATDGIVFGPLKGWPRTFERKEWNQIEHQAARQRAAGTRKHRRAEGKLRLAATLAPDQSKERLNDAADRVALRLAMRAARA